MLGKLELLKHPEFDLIQDQWLQNRLFLLMRLRESKAPGRARGIALGTINSLAL